MPAASRVLSPVVPRIVVSHVSQPREPFDAAEYERRVREGPCFICAIAAPPIAAALQHGEAPAGPARNRARHRNAAGAGRELERQRVVSINAQLAPDIFDRIPAPRCRESPEHVLREAGLPALAAIRRALSDCKRTQRLFREPVDGFACISSLDQP